MTAFNEILAAEEEAVKSIETAKEEAATAEVNARAERKVQIDAETTRLAEVEKKELNSHEASIKEKTDKIQAEVKTKVSSIEKKFDTHKADLTEELKKSFA